MATRPPAGGARSTPSHRWPILALAAAALALPACSLLATPRPPSVHDSSLAPSGPVGYVVCPAGVTPVELDTRTPEATIPLPLARPPALGNFAIATSPDGRWAYVVTTIGGTAPAPASSSTASPIPPSSQAAGSTSEVIPIDLVNQQADRPIVIPGQGGTHALVVLPGGRTVLAANGTTIVPVDPATHRVGTPLDLGAGHTVYGLALAPDGTTLYTLVPGGVIPVNTSTASAGAEIPTGLSISSVYSPHGIAVTDDGTTVYVVGQGGTDFGGRVLPVVAHTGASLPTAGFDRYGISDPAAVAVVPDGSSLLVVDSANNWVNPVVNATFTDPPPPVRLPQRSGLPSVSGTQHPTDVVLGPGGTGAFIVDGFTAVIPYQPETQTFGRPVAVCSGASSMAVAPAP
jgi:DNA-binding beta-propeller fold protein YncE